MKKLTLNQTWRKCLKMWKWIVENLNKDEDVDELKDRYVEEKLKGDVDIYNGCYFCDWNSQQGIYTDPLDSLPACSQCPGVLVSPKFRCEGKSYCWHTKPRAFYRKLLELDKKRKAK